MMAKRTDQARPPVPVAARTTSRVIGVARSASVIGPARNELRIVLAGWPNVPPSRSPPALPPPMLPLEDGLPYRTSGGLVSVPAEDRLTTIKGSLFAGTKK